MIALGVVILFFIIKISVIIKAVLILSLALSFLLFAYIISRQRKGMFVGLITCLSRIKFLKKRLFHHLEKAAEIDSKMAYFWKNERKAFLLSFISMWIVKATGTLELYLIMHFLNYPISISMAALLFILSNVMMIVLCFIPSQVGVATGGFSLVFKSLGYSSEYGTLLGIFRRVKCIFWAGAGLLFIPLLGISSVKDEEENTFSPDDLSKEVA
jgi:hypothetical protein